jgi:hypothetical protein
LESPGDRLAQRVHVPGSKTNASELIGTGRGACSGANSNTEACSSAYAVADGNPAAPADAIAHRDSSADTDVVADDRRHALVDDARASIDNGGSLVDDARVAFVNNARAAMNHMPGTRHYHASAVGDPANRVGDAEHVRRAADDPGCCRGLDHLGRGARDDGRPRHVHFRRWYVSDRRRVAGNVHRRGRLDDWRDRPYRFNMHYLRGNRLDGEQRLPVAQPVQVKPLQTCPVLFVLKDQDAAVFVMAVELADRPAALVDDAELVHLPVGHRGVEAEPQVKILRRTGGRVGSQGVDSSAVCLGDPRHVPGRGVAGDGRVGRST